MSDESRRRVAQIGPSGPARRKTRRGVEHGWLSLWQGPTATCVPRTALEHGTGQPMASGDVCTPDGARRDLLHGLAEAGPHSELVRVRRLNIKLVATLLVERERKRENEKHGCPLQLPCLG